MTLLDTLEAVKAETDQILEEGAKPLTAAAYLNNAAFASDIPMLQTAWDSTSLAAFKKCPRFYQYKILEGYNPLGVGPSLKGQTNPHIIFGTIFHSADELYHHLIADGLDHDTALQKVIYFVLLETWDPDTNSPWASDEPTKTRQTLLRTVIWYLDFFRDQRLKTLILANGKAAVELSFRIVLSDLADSDNRATYRSPDGIEYILCGHLDRMAEFNGDIYTTDKKTTKFLLNDQYFQQFSPNVQVTVYSIAGAVTFKIPVAGLVIDGCQVLVNGTRFRRETIPRTSAQLEEFLLDLQFLLREAESYARHQHWPLRETSCGFGAMQCEYRKLICSADPSVRQDYLDSFFSRRKWDPMTPR